MKSMTQLRLKLKPDHAADLERIGTMCRHARNAAIEDWLLRQRGMPPNPKQRDELTESTKLYHAVTAAVPELDTQVASLIASAINTLLSAKLDWRRGAGEDGKRPRRRDAILRYEDRPPFWSGLEIPVRSKTAKLVYGPRTYLDILPIRGERLQLDILTDKMPPKLKKVLLSVANGEAKFADSRICLKGDKWYWMLPVANETLERCQDRVLELSPIIPVGENELKPWPFLATFGRSRWHIGDGRYYEAQMSRLWRILKEIGYQYRNRDGTGHGRKKFDRAMMLRRKQMADVASEFRRKTIVSVLDQCDRWGCGLIQYREPTLPVRDKCWFAEHGVDWDWTRFLGDLKNAAARKGIVVSVVKLKMSEVVRAQTDKSAVSSG